MPTVCARWRILVGVLACLNGCVSYYRAETVLHADGSVERAVYQPESSAVKLSAENGWSQKRHVAPVDDERWRGGIRDLPATSDKQYVAASGRFASPEALPGHLSFPTPDGKDRGELVRVYETRDWGLVVEHVWCETLTDVVTLAGFRDGIDELVERGTSDLEIVVNNVIGKEYDTEELFRWLRTEGRAWAHAAGSILYEHAAREGGLEQVESSLIREVLAVSAHYGLDLRDATGGLRSELAEDNEAYQREILEFARRKLRQLLRRRDGEPVPDAVIEELVMAASSPDRLPSQKWQNAMAQMVAKRYGTADKRDEVYGRAATRVFGVHLLSGGRFHYAMCVPGLIVETNGELMGPQHVVWRFHQRDAFPLGKSMRVRSLVADAELQRALLGAERLRTLEQLQHYVTLVSPHEELRAELVASARARNLDPLRSFYQARRAMRDTETLEVLDDLLKLLDIAL